MVAALGLFWMVARRNDLSPNEYWGRERDGALAVKKWGRGYFLDRVGSGK